MSDTAAYSYHKQMLSMANELLGQIEQKKREVSGITMAVSDKQREDIKKMTQDFRNAVMRYLENNPDVPNTVLQLNLQLFPVVE